MNTIYSIIYNLLLKIKLTSVRMSTNNHRLPFGMTESDALGRATSQQKSIQKGN